MKPTRMLLILLAVTVLAFSSIVTYGAVSAQNQEPRDVEIVLSPDEIMMPLMLEAGLTLFEVVNLSEIEYNFAIEGPGVQEALDEPLQPGESNNRRLLYGCHCTHNITISGQPYRMRTCQGMRHKVTSSRAQNNRNYLTDQNSAASIPSTTSRRSAPTTSGCSTSGSSTFPGRATKAVAHPARRAPAISHA